MSNLDDVYEEMRLVREYINREKTADEMFEELGYEKDEYGTSQIVYSLIIDEEGFCQKSITYTRRPRKLLLEGYFTEKELEVILQLCKERLLLK